MWFDLICRPWNLGARPKLRVSGGSGQSVEASLTCVPVIQRAYKLNDEADIDYPSPVVKWKLNTLLLAFASAQRPPTKADLKTMVRDLQRKCFRMEMGVERQKAESTYLRATEHDLCSCSQYSKTGGQGTEKERLVLTSQRILKHFGDGR